MAKKSLLGNIFGEKQTKSVKSKVSSPSPDDSVIEHLWMTEDHDKNIKKSAVKKDSRIDTGILRDRIANKIAKMNNH